MFGLEVLLIAIPQYILWSPWPIAALTGYAGYAQAVFTFSSCVNLFAYIVTNGDFRAQLIHGE